MYLHRFAGLLLSLATLVTQVHAASAFAGSTRSHPTARDASHFDRQDCLAYRHAALSTNVEITAMMGRAWSRERRAAFERLLAAADVFGNAVAENEIDHAVDDTCQRQAVRTAERRNFMRTLTAILTFEKTDASLLTFGEADGALNATFRDVMAVEDPQSLAWGSVDKAGIRRTERAWLAYRDAFVAFAATLDQAGAAERVKIELTARRATSLQAFLAD